VSAPNETVAFDPITCTPSADELFVTYGTTQEPRAPGTFTASDRIKVVRLADQGTLVAERFEAFGSPPSLALHPQLARDPEGGLHVIYLGSAASASAGTLRWSRLLPGEAEFRDGPVLDEALPFTRTWGDDLFLGDYHGAAASAETLLVAHGTLAGDGPHILFRRRALAD
jgi:hypothetical protein